MVENLKNIKGGTFREVYTDMEELVNWPCPLCGSDKDTLIKVERGLLKIVKCIDCSLIRVNPRLKHPEGIYHGDIETFKREFKLIVSGEKPHHRDLNYNTDLDIIKRYKPNGEFLDIGTNVGSFLRLARGKGWNISGVEPSESLATLAKEFFGLNIVNSYLEEANLKSDFYDIVTMTDVFEHIVNPKDILTEIKRILKPDGIIFIKVPNGKFNEFKYNVRSKVLGNKDADDFDSYEHVCHYSDKTLGEMLSSCEFKVLDMMIDLPVQLPSWHKHVGVYYQYPSPFFLDWQAHLGRDICYYLSKIERMLTGKIGFLAPTITCVATIK